ncbi:hypothetical protein ACFQ1B_03245 [Streptomyces mexicanus]
MHHPARTVLPAALRTAFRTALRSGLRTGRAPGAGTAARTGRVPGTGTTARTHGPPVLAAAGRSRRARLPVVVTVLAALLLGLPAALGVPGPPTGGPGVPVADAVAGSAAVVPHADSGPRADDADGTACTLRTAVRRQQPGDHPAPRGHAATHAQGTAVTPPGPGRPRAPTDRAPSAAQPPPARDRGRAPPATSGT